jgi:hypothetical protein
MRIDDAGQHEIVPRLDDLDFSIPVIIGRETYDAAAGNRDIAATVRVTPVVVGRERARPLVQECCQGGSGVPAIQLILTSIVLYRCP